MDQCSAIVVLIAVHRRVIGMKVVYFSQDYTPHDHRFLAALAGTDHEVHYLRLEAAGLVKESRPVPHGIRTIDWWGGRRPVRGLGRLRAVWDVRRVMDQIDPDLVHAGPVQSTAAVAAAAGAAPLVTMSWGSDLLSGAQSGWGRWVARSTLARSAAVACDCQTVRRRAIDLGAPEERIFVFPWGVDLQKFHPARNMELRALEGWGRNQVVILSTRAWEPLYGVPELIEGFVLAAEEEPRLRLVMLGGGSLKEWVYRRLEAADLLGRVAFPGQVENDELPDYYRTSDLYLSASRSDGSSVSLMEALACGVPALVSDIPANREWVTPGHNGWWFAMGEADDLARALLGAAGDRTDRETMRESARAVAERKADWSRNFEVLLRAYEFAAGEG